MPEYDLVLVHPPSVYDFREKGLICGPVADLIPSTPVFEMYPIGFTTIASMLHSNGYRSRILNLAAHMLADGSFDAERMIRKIRSKVFGVDLHWLPHAHGSIEVARMIKEQHPDSQVVLGGFSATYFHEEIMSNYPYIDALFLGDSTELPMLEYVRSLESGLSMERVPNLVYRDDGRIRNNGITHIIENLDEVELDYGLIVKSAIRTLDLTGHLPYLDWKRNPMLLVTMVRGCSAGCITCMGACSSFKRNFGRERPAFRSPEKLLEDIRQIDSYFRGAIFLLGDIQQPGKEYSERLLSLIRNERPGNEIAFEFFEPPTAELVNNIGSSVELFDAQISPDSHDPKVRANQGRNYSNEALEKAISNLLSAGTQRVDLFFMIGLEGQDMKSVNMTVDYCDQLLKKERAESKLLPFISPLAPFIDPGSEVFENPERHGYMIFARTLQEHRELLTRPSWKHVLNYETRWMNRDQIVSATYQAADGLNNTKLNAGAITPESAELVKLNIQLAQDTMDRVDFAMNSIDSESLLKALRDEVQSLGESTVCNKRELDWSERSFYWSIPRALFAILRGR